MRVHKQNKTSPPSGRKSTEAQSLGSLLGDSDHAAELLAGEAARRRFVHCCFAVQIRFSDRGQRNLVLPQKILGLDSGQTQHFRNLVESQSLIAVAF